MFCASHPVPHEKSIAPRFIRDGRFELRGCDPKRRYRLYFLEHTGLEEAIPAPEVAGSNRRLWMPGLIGDQRKLGAVVEISPRKSGAKPVVVRLAPTSAVRLRFQKADGKPAAKHTLWLQLVVSPGPSVSTALAKGTLAAEVVHLVAPYRTALHGPLQADAKGRLTVQGLIPGATYRVLRPNREPLKDFQVEAGKTQKVTVVVK
jgi:hypothetical protein